MPHCAFLTMDDIGDYVTYDHLLIEPLKAANWQVDMVSWRKQTDWNQYALVIIRTPWDYQEDPQQFLQVLADIEQSSARLENPLEIVRWNIDKQYLTQLQQQGCPIVPTQFKQTLSSDDVLTAFENFDCDRLIIKPSISASSIDTFPVSRSEWSQQSANILPVFQHKTAMLQPFVDAVVEEGEYSLFYFAGELSHTILKTPQTGDFRVQEEYGGVLKLVTPEPALQRAGQLAVDAIGQTLLYARVDLIRMPDNSFALMELELIEPSLYFNMDQGSAQRFVKQLEAWMG